MRQLCVYINERMVGNLSENQDVWSFKYDSSWAEAPDAFDLSPWLARKQLLHVDGASNRTVQWYFDNLLPEEAQRVLLSREAGIQGDDAFALLQYLGAESAGSLVLRPCGELTTASGTRLQLDFDDLSQRIRRLPRRSLSFDAPKRMSAAGAQNKLLVVYREGRLYEPQGLEPSTHILKPEHGSEDYPASVINEFATMTLAKRLGLSVPAVIRLYVPEPVYLVDRFDRRTDHNNQVQRTHIIDACQLLNKPRAYKYAASSLEALKQCAEHCDNKASARLRLFQWLLFNVLIGNDDIHLKNLSFAVSAFGIELCPAYDLLSTAAYHTRAYADERAIWPNVPLMIPLPGAVTFAEVNRQCLRHAGAELGIDQAIADREIDTLMRKLSSELDAVISDIELKNPSLPGAGGLRQASDLRLLSVIKHIVVKDMLNRIEPKTAPQ